MAVVDGQRRAFGMSFARMRPLTTGTIGSSVPAMTSVGCQERKPGQAGPAKAGDQLQVIAVVARPAHMAKMRADLLGRGPQRAAINVAGIWRI